ncbi:unnamed protein product [Moneuplotes crassus]|uniref:SAM domain-containing protein n=1 Tax=Euplotes crassus TaxID=5936 RepID=A0AAD1UDG2_EUPCR|nr:unnamed protein product [Moneuplotes crassus]
MERDNPHLYGVLDKASKMISSTKCAIDKYTSHKNSVSSERESKQIKSLNSRKTYKTAKNTSRRDNPPNSNPKHGFEDRPQFKFHRPTSPVYDSINSSEGVDFKPVSVKLKKFVPEETENFSYGRSETSDARNVTTEDEMEFGPKKNTFEPLLTLEIICSALHIDKYYHVLRRNEIEVEDIFILTEEDLIEMRFSIGARNRLLQFQTFFKKNSKANIQRMEAFDRLLEAILDTNLGYSLSNFLTITRATKNDLLKAMKNIGSDGKSPHQASRTKYLSNNPKNPPQRNNYLAQDNSSEGKRNSSIGSYTNYTNFAERSSQASSNIYTTNIAARAESDKENNFYDNCEANHPSKPRKEGSYNTKRGDKNHNSSTKGENNEIYNQIMNFNTHKVPYKNLKGGYLNKYENENTFLSNKLNLIQQEEPKSNYCVQNKVSYCGGSRDKEITETIKPPRYKKKEHSGSIIRTSTVNKPGRRKSKPPNKKIKETRRFKRTIDYN